MTIPGFGAGASLNKLKESYVLTGGAPGETPGVLPATQLVYVRDFCLDTCGGDARCLLACREGDRWPDYHR